MICPVCSGKTQVSATRTPQKPGKGSEVARGNDLVGWYTPEFVVRKRVCVDCNHNFKTIEISFEDMGAIIQESTDGHAPDEKLWKKH
jgi:transcriptional regulator NrdR family protein|tara:strand:+ start:2849 stop:3109 length:261 start_codon:yes stop_codon:yes gene_type:complete